MTYAWLAYVVVFSGILFSAASLLELGVRRVKLPARWIWAAVLVAAVVIPFATYMGAPPTTSPMVTPAISLEGSLEDQFEFPLGESWSASGALPTGLGTESMNIEGLLSTGTGLFSKALGAPVFWFWGSLSLSFILLMAGSIVSLRRASRGWVCREVDGRSVLVSRWFGPAVVGLLRGKIVVPDWAVSLGEADRNLLLLHEEEHLRSGDLRLLALGWVAVAVMPWNPFMWLAQRRLISAVEADCDFRVLRHCERPHAYANLLVDVLERKQRHPMLALGMGQSAKGMERRLRLMGSFASQRWVGRGVLAAVLAGVLVLVACELPEPARIVGPEFAEAGETSVVRALLVDRSQWSEENRTAFNRALSDLRAEHWREGNHLAAFTLHQGASGSIDRVKVEFASDGTTWQDVLEVLGAVVHAEFAPERVLQPGEQARIDLWVVATSGGVELVPLARSELNTRSKAETYMKLRSTVIMELIPFEGLQPMNGRGLARPERTASAEADGPESSTRSTRIVPGAEDLIEAQSSRPTTLFFPNVSEEQRPWPVGPVKVYDHNGNRLPEAEATFGDQIESPRQSYLDRIDELTDQIYSINGSVIDVREGVQELIDQGAANEARIRSALGAVRGEEELQLRGSDFSVGGALGAQGTPTDPNGVNRSKTVQDKSERANFLRSTRSDFRGGVE